MKLWIALLFGMSAFAQTKQRVFYLPRPAKPAPYRAPMKPLVRLADLEAKHRGSRNWSELVILDNNSRAQVISAAPGSKIARHLHPDAPEWWVVQRGRIRFEIETAEGKFQTIEAAKGSYVYAPERQLHSLEVIGDEPAIRFEVTLSESASVWETPPGEGEYIPVNLQTGPNPSDVQNPGGAPDRIFFNVDDLAAKHRDQSAWTETVMRKNRVRGNLICGHTKDNPARQAAGRGHLHAGFAEFWIVMKGRLEWIMEGIEQPLAAGEGDIVYAPPNRFHSPQFAGEGLACRLTSSTYPAANHIYDAK
jgi:oxalate decarboxylase/phosphoglucose isomerase-like protein (cupin superfamily)